MKKVLAMLLVGIACAAASAAELKLTPSDTIETVLAANKGKRVTVRLRSGQEITGIVREAGSRVVQLGAVSGKDFFDAVVPLEAIEAVFIRTKD